MATLTSEQCSAGVQPKGTRVGLVAVAATYSITGSMSTGDVVQMIKVPAGATVVDIKVKAFPVGSGPGSVTVGDGIDTDRYIVATAISASAPIMTISNASFRPYTYSADDTIDILVSASVTWSGITGGFDLLAIFSMDVEPYTGP